jgi:hypothetical protein
MGLKKEGFLVEEHQRSVETWVRAGVVFVVVAAVATLLRKK